MSNSNDMGLKDVLETFQNRIKSPLMGSIILAFFEVNWREILYLLFNTDLKITERITYFDAQTDIFSLFILPVTIGSFIALAMPFINFGAAWVVKWPTTQNRLLGIQSASDSLTAREDLAAQRKKTLAAEEAADIERLKRDKKVRDETEQAEITEAQSRAQERRENERAEISTLEQRATERREQEENEIAELNSRKEQRTKDETAEIAAFKQRAQDRAKEEAQAQTALRELQDTVTKRTPKAKSVSDTKPEKLPPAPSVTKKLQVKAEKEAIEILRAGKIVPANIGMKVRVIGGARNPVTLKRFAQLKHCLYLKEAYLDKSTATDFYSLVLNQYLEILFLTGTKISSVAPLVKLQKLWNLDLRNTAVKDVSQLANIKSLKVLYLGGGKFVDMSSLSKLTNVRSLNLWQSIISDMSPISKMPQLSTLSLYFLK